VTIVVSETSPVRALAHLGRLELLRELFTQVIVPPAVAKELRNPPGGQIAVDVDTLTFVTVHAVSDPANVDQFQNDLDPGESEALAIALELEAQFILMDEAAGRKKAKEVGLTPIGVLGVLLEAKRRGDRTVLRPLLDQLQNELHFFISPGLRAEVLRQAGESS
jgi:predicted nucleic acid-binding protein